MKETPSIQAMKSPDLICLGVFSHCRCTSDMPTVLDTYSTRIIGDILEYHFLCRNPTFNAPQYTSAVRENILQHMQTWFDSFSRNLPPNFCEIISIRSEIPALAYYALYLYHCLHILLYGQMDLISMYEDARWQASSDFLVVGEHAIICANVSIQLSPPDLLSTLRSVDSLYTP